MAVYNEIISWSQSRPMFIRDAIRRLLANITLTEADISELILILKKEIGFPAITISGIPVTDTHIPTSPTQINPVAKLISIKKPINICALYNDAELNFDTNGLTLIYGNNGSGKSSYSKLLKKLCWSRDNNIQLKKNVNTQDTTNQSVTLTFEDQGAVVPFDWKENNATHSALNSIFVFDSNCASIYVNDENPSEYKPIGIDILDKLIELCKNIDNQINAEINLLTASKPSLDQKYAQTDLFQWYSSIETITPLDINTKLVFPESIISRKKELSTLLNSTNPIEIKQMLSQKRSRYITFAEKLTAIEYRFSEESICKIIELKRDYDAKSNAYEIAKGKLSGNDPLKGVGSQTWRQLWNAAKLFAITEVHPQSHNYPDYISSDICELCQQPLSDDAKRRLERFDLFIQDQTSKDFSAVNERISIEINRIDEIVIERTDTCDELGAEISSFDNDFKTFIEQITAAKQIIIDFLKSNIKEIPLPKIIELSSTIKSRILKIDSEIIQKEELIKNRTSFEREFLDIEVLEILTRNKNGILQYITEYKSKNLLIQCKSKTVTTSISKKIGDILESEAIQIQHNEFISHLTSLSGNISSKVQIKKSRTSSGVTYQKCGFISIGDSLNSVLSEGEQKVVALANFLSECTIDGAKNSIIFDDPVNSLDQDFREAIAKKIVELSSDRQVIVLTHDLYFLRLLMDTNKQVKLSDCDIIGLSQINGISGIPSDEIPYLVKNVQQRIDTIDKGLKDVQTISIEDIRRRESEIESLRQRMRKLLERTIEDIIVNKTIERFSKNINLKAGNLSNVVVTEKNDVDFLLGLFGKYSISEHDGGIETIPLMPNENDIKLDLADYKIWKDNFKEKVREYKVTHNIQK
ncbi:AAA family ATPase [Dysgonomonas sp. ZJ709]|uniref:AAA family ATPase n=1 Tax=Dysgonomonas sp. ZJ709 TaxID=2709797 RepID=UPI0013E9D57A|nr:AAA family ATPase [Dysgonomonas sp. ZJ709]